MTLIAPMLYMQNLAGAMEFYKKAFGALERWRIDHAGRVHVAEMIIDGVLFRLHDETPQSSSVGPPTAKATTVVLHLIVDDPDSVAKRAVSAGATELDPVRDFEYGYRQGVIRVPFGHHWCLEKFVSM